MSNPTLKIKVLPRYPSNITGTSPIEVTDVNGNKVIGIDTSNITVSGDNVIGGGIGTGTLVRVTMSVATTTAATVTGATRTAALSDAGKLIPRSNSGANMQDTLPAGGPAGIYAYKNIDGSGAILALVAGVGATINGSATRYILLGAHDTAIFNYDGTNWRTIAVPDRARLLIGQSSTIYVATTAAVALASDNNPGVLSTLPKATRQAIADEVQSRYDVGAGKIDIQCTGNFTDAGVTVRGRPPGLGNSAAGVPQAHTLRWLGDPVTPSNCTITATSGNCFNAINNASFHIDGFKLVSNAGSAISSSYGSLIGLGAIEYGACASGNHIQASFWGGVHFDNNYTVSGGAQCHMAVSYGGTIEDEGGAVTATVTGTPAFSVATVSVQSGGRISAGGLTFSGSATGTRFSVGPFGGSFLIGTLGTDANTLIPGNANGTYTNVGSGYANGVDAAGTFTTVTASTSVTTPILKATGALTIQTNGGTLAGTITTGQRWGFGTETAPTVPFVFSNNSATGITFNGPPFVAFVNADGSATNFQVVTYGSGVNSGFVGQSARGTAASPSQTLANDVTVFFATKGYTNASAFDSNLTGLAFLASEAHTSSAQGIYGQVITTPTGSTTRVAGVTYHASGGVAIGGQTIASPANDPGAGGLITTGLIKSKGATAGIGYVTGAGNAVTQLTSRTTGVTINNVCGAITLLSQVNTAISAATAQSFTVTNSAVAATDTIRVVQQSGTDKYMIFVTNVAAGSFQITNFTTGGTTNEAPVFNFSVIKGVTS